MKYPKYPVTADADYHTYLFFSEGDARIFVEGSTLARTRLYQGRNYEAFLIAKK